METMAGRCLLNIELKGDGTALPVSGILEVLIEGGKWRKEDILVSSFSPVSLKDFMDAGTDVKTAILVDGNPGGAEEFALQVGAAAVNPNHHFLDRDFLDKCRKSGLEVNAWTVNDPDEMERMISMGVDGIITDRPDLLVEKINNCK
jgi:glycerophosphoryl diester phosphodiesterase